MSKAYFKRLLVVFLDIFIVFISYHLAYLLRFELVLRDMKIYMTKYNYLLIVLLIHLIFNYVWKLDRTIWAKVSLDESIRIVNANLLAFFIILFLRTIGILIGFPFSVMFFMVTMNILGQFSYRILFRYYRIIRIRQDRKESGIPILIYGAGSAGQMLAREIIENEQYHYDIIGFIDDNTSIKNASIYSYPILGDRTQISKIVDQYGIEEIVVAMPSESLKTRKEIIEYLLQFDVRVQTVTSSQALIRGGKSQNVIRRINISDLLERPEIKIDDCSIQTHHLNQSIMVTGAGGSIGSELVRQLLKTQLKRLILIDISETALYNIEQEIQMMIREGKIQEIELHSLILSIRDKEALEKVFEQYRPNLVYHAAAHKHVPLMEKAPKEAVKNNIFGTHNLILLSDKYQVERFINISTDKAVNPTNVMGATKRFNEMMLQAYNKTSQTQFVAVRFGNVLGSNGSVVPLFQKQIERGGPVTVTHPDIIRYFMTIPEAVSLVLQAGTYANGGEIFVLDMGEPVKIAHLAEKVIELSGYRPHEDIEIQFTGLRPGEKLYEELLMAEEGLQKTENKLIFIANPIDYEVNVIESKLQDLDYWVNHCTDELIIKKLQEIVPTYRNVKEEL